MASKTRLETLILFLRTVRHVRWKQLLFRLLLTVRRQIGHRFVALSRNRLSPRKDFALDLSKDLPEAIFHPRRGIIERKRDHFAFTILNQCRTLSLPIDWRLREMQYGTRLWLLNLHYMEYLEETSDSDFQLIVSDWIDHVKPYERDFWKFDWNSYALSIRMVVWMQQYVRRFEALPESFREEILISLDQQIRFLVGNLERDIGGNHLIKNIKALLWAARFWSHSDAALWSSLGQRLLSKQLNEQILSDGMHYELSPAYHVQVFADLLECYSVLPEGKLKIRLADQLKMMAQVTVDLTHPDGMISLFNDGGLHMTYDPCHVIRAWERLTEETADLSKHVQLEDAGYYGYRDNDTFFLVDCGKVAPDYLTAHGHGDIFAFEWSIGGKRIFIDTGVFEYNPGERRDISRSTGAHNTVTLDGNDQCEFWGSFRMARRARIEHKAYSADENGFRLAGRHDGFRRLAGSPIHERTVHITGTEILVEDRIIGGSGQKVEAHLVLHPECSVDTASGVTIIQRGDVTCRLVSDGDVSVRPFEWYPDFGVQIPSMRITIYFGDAPVAGSFSIRCHHAGK